MDETLELLSLSDKELKARINWWGVMIKDYNKSIKLCQSLRHEMITSSEKDRFPKAFYQQVGDAMISLNLGKINAEKRTTILSNQLRIRSPQIVSNTGMIEKIYDYFMKK